MTVVGGRIRVERVKLRERNLNGKNWEFVISVLLF